MTTSETRNYAYPAAIGGSIGFGMMMTNRLSFFLGPILGTLAGAFVASGIALVIYQTVDQFTKRGVLDRFRRRGADSKVDP